MSNQVGKAINAINVARMQWIQCRGFHPQSMMAKSIHELPQSKFVKLTQIVDDDDSIIHVSHDGVTIAGSGTQGMFIKF